MATTIGAACRRGAASAIAALAVVAGLTACSTSNQTESEPASGPGTGFPVTVDHGQGSADIASTPQRVVTLGWTDAQIANALGAPIVASVRNPASVDGNWPGMKSPLPEEVLALDSVTPNVEKIASYRPDLILMTSAQPSFSEIYDKLSNIAPTISYRTALLQDDGDDLTTMIGAALGKSDEARQLITSSDKAIGDFAASLPGLQGARAVFGQNYQGSTGVITARTAPVVRFLERLGLTAPDELVKLAESNALGTAQLADENLGLLDTADIAFVNTPGGQDEFAALPIVQSLTLTTTGNIHYTGNDVASLMLTPNPAVTTVLLDQLGGPLTEFATRRD
ncbi:iron complex transport system substrate-binding protein [Rhodococcus sp. 27YEA15]|uniref:ABC transporter substrate-binding protein n=1 Tax=Rhodococcus sp. 27YEA15 TaxID=3156259 RepID=UPI003C7B4393